MLEKKRNDCISLAGLITFLRFVESRSQLGVGDMRTSPRVDIEYTGARGGRPVVT
jgi:hypothetical protein